MAAPPPSKAALLLRDARVVLKNPEAAPVGSWTRAVAVLGRRSLEAAIDDVYRSAEPTMVHARTTRAKLICLGCYIDPSLAADVAYTWARLSDACHHHVYDLPPSADELQAWIDTTSRLVARSLQRSTPMAASRPTSTDVRQ